MKNMDLYEHECGYFPELTCRADYQLLPDIDAVRACYSEVPEDITNEQLQIDMFTKFTQAGYRRASNLLYKNVCPHCSRCKSIRIDVQRFLPSKSQRKVLRINKDIAVYPCTNQAEFITPEKIALYRKYSLKHNAEMISEEKAIEELLYWHGMESLDSACNYSGTMNMEYLLGDRLVACSVIDEMEDGVSSVYFYYDTDRDIMRRSLGTFSALYEIKQLQMIEAEYYYLGYYIAGHKNMAYKANFKPYELLNAQDEWQSGEPQ